MRLSEIHVAKCPHCGGELVSEDQIAEKQDACYHKVKSRYKVWPSAYASGALVQCRKKGAANWGNKSKNEHAVKTAETKVMTGISSYMAEGDVISLDAHRNTVMSGEFVQWLKHNYPDMTLKDFSNPVTRNKLHREFIDQNNKPDIAEAPGDFGLGARYRNVPDEEMQAFLSRTKGKEKTKRDKFDYPYVHASNIKIKNEAGREYDLDSLRKAIMTRPTHILGQNTKMQHSETGTEAIFDIGLPALKGLAVNEKTGQFVIVDTCPGSGVCKTYCYAMKGSYVMFPAVSMGLARMLNFLLNDPDGFANKLNAEIAAARSKMAKKGIKIVVRWHDAGDFFSPEYLDMAYKVASDNPDVKFYAYTKIADVATGERPKNFNMNFSQGALPSQEKKIDFKRVKHSKVVPKDMFFDLVARKGLNLIKDAKGRMQFASSKNFEEFKTRMSKNYAIDKASILTYDEMMDKPVGDEPKWNVIVMPGDGDRSANRMDVIGTYLLFH